VPLALGTPDEVVEGAQSSKFQSRELTKRHLASPIENYVDRACSANTIRL